MWNVMKAQMYQLKKDVLAFSVALLGLAVTFIANMEAFEQGMTGSEGMAYMGESMSALFGLLAIMIIVANVMGKDFADKTLNYEILSGHTRKEVFFGRLVVATIPGVLCSFLTIIAFPLTLTLINGWGNTMELSGVLVRFGLIFITLFRIAFELAFLTTQTYFEDFAVTPLLPVANCLNLLTFQDWTTFYLDETDQILYSSAVSSEMALWAIIPSVVIGGVMILLSYVFFKHDDLN